MVACMANGLDGYEEPNTTNYFKEANSFEADAQ